MTDAGPEGKRRGPDWLGIILVGTLAALALGAASLVIAQGYMTAGALVGLTVVGGCFVVLHGIGNRPPPPKNADVHGAARPASQQEAQRAARGEAQGPRLDDREY